jgi:Uncharacterized distant relative of cell wall-associated hydrolases
MKNQEVIIMYKKKISKKIFAGILSLSVFILPLNLIKSNQFEFKQIETKQWSIVKKRCQNLKASQNFTYPKNIKGAILVTKDNLTGLVPFVGHAAIVVNSHQVVQASPFGGVHYGPNDWDTSKITCYAVVPKHTTQKNRIDSAIWAQNQIGKNYNVFFNLWENPNAKSFYCSQIIWAAYYNECNIDIAPSRPMILFPVHLLSDSKTTDLIYYKDDAYE